MPIFEELQPPEFHFNREQSTGKRVIRIPLSGNLIPFLTAEFPATIGQGFPAPDDFFPTPGLQWLFVNDIDVAPWDDLFDGAFPPNPTNGWKVTVGYTSKKYGIPSENQGNDLPGGKGPGQGNTDVMLSYDVDIGGNFLTFPSNCLAWASDGKRVPRDVQFGIVDVTLEHTITWHHVAFPPWAAIRRCAGNINATTFLGAPPGCLLFLGCNGSREFDMTGNRTWTLKYRFSEKTPPNPPQTIASGVNQNNFGPGGWNYYLRPDLNPVAWDVILLYTSALTSMPIYPYQVMDNLFLPAGT